MKHTFKLISLANIALLTQGCSDFYMNFTNPSIRLSARTMDLGSTNNWTITTWPVGSVGVSSGQHQYPDLTWKSIYGTIGMTGNWIGDNHYLFPRLFGDSMNDQGLSCGQLTLVGTRYQNWDRKKVNVMYGDFCQYVASLYATVDQLHQDLPDISIWGPPILGEHFIIRDATGSSLIIELVDGQQNVYLDPNDGVTGFGIMTNEPEFDWHLTNIEHYEWKRTLARQAIAVPGGYYPEDRYLRVYMIKEGMDAAGLTATSSFQEAFSYTAQVLNSVTLPMGEQYGTDTGEASGEGEANDHTIWGIIRDHKNPGIYWRDAGNPTFRKLSLSDLDLTEGATSKSILMETGPYFIDMSQELQ